MKSQTLKSAILNAEMIELCYFERKNDTRWCESYNRGEFEREAL